MTKYPRLFYGVFFFSLLTGFNCQAEEALLDNMQITLENEQTQAEFTLNGSVTPKVRQFTNPERIVIDFPATKFGKPLKVENPAASIISKIKGSKPDEESLRFVFELKQPVQVRSRILSGRVLGQQKLIIALIPGAKASAEKAISTVPVSSSLSAKDKGGEGNWKEQLRILNQRFAAQEQTIRELQATVARQGRVLAIKSKGRKMPDLPPAKSSFTPKQMAKAKPQPTTKKAEIKRKPVREKGIETVLREEHAIFEHGITVEPGFSYSRIDRNRVALSGFLVLDAIALGQISIDEVESDVLLFDVTGRYGITDRLQVDLNIPFLHRSTTYRNTADVGNKPEEAEQTVDLDFALSDISFGFSYQLLGESKTWPDIVWSTRARAPSGTHPFGIKEIKVTGDEDKVKVAFPEALPTGNGNWAVTSGLSFVKTLDPAVIFASFSYTYNLEEDYKDISATIGKTLPGSVKLGDSFQFGLGFAIALNESITMSIAYSHRYGVESETRVLGGEWSKILGSDVNSSQLNFGLVYSFTPRFSVVASAAAGLTNDAPDSQFSLKFPYTF